MWVQISSTVDKVYGVWIANTKFVISQKKSWKFKTGSKILSQIKGHFYNSAKLKIFRFNLLV